jgi:hypothetical protein
MSFNVSSLDIDKVIIKCKLSNSSLSAKTLLAVAKEKTKHILESDREVEEKVVACLQALTEYEVYKISIVCDDICYTSELRGVL